MESTAAVLHRTAELSDLTDDRPINVETIDVAEPTGEEVLVEIVAASLCHTDLAMIDGTLAEQLPLVMGHEGAGIVREVGKDVTSVTPGDHVVLGRTACGACEHCRRGASNICKRRLAVQPEGTLRTGAVRFSANGGTRYHCHGVSSFSEYTLVTEEVAVPITDDLPLEEATLLGCAVFTGAGAVMNTANIEPASSVVIFGAGGVGLSGVQAASLRAADPIVVVDPILEKLELAREMGATRGVNPNEEDPVERVREITGEGADYAFDMVGDEAVVGQVLDTLGPAGTGVAVGMAPAGKRGIDIDLQALVIGEKRLVGSFNGSYNLESAIPNLARLAADGKLALDSMISDAVSLDEIYDAIEALHNGSALRQVLIP